jgi:RNA polymerase sigma-70 factor (ECF subfamily)
MSITTSLINEVLAGDKEKFRHIIQECNPSLYRIGLAILKNEADAEDALQTAYMKAYLHLESFRKESSLLTWITRILINECKMMLRKKKKSISLDSEEAMEKPSSSQGAVEELNNKQLNMLLEDAVMNLPESYRLVYVVREVNDCSTEITANTLGISQENVKVRLHRAKSMIRETLLQKISMNELFPFHKVRCNMLADKVMIAINSLVSVKQQ